MSRLEELFDIKERAMSDLITDDCLVNAVTLKDVDEPIVERVELLYRNIFPYKKGILETLKDKMCFITMDTASFKPVSGGHYKGFSLMFFVIVHEELIKMKLGNRTVTRTDYLIHRIDKIFNQTQGFGIGELQFGGTRSIELPNNWTGMAIFYETVNFN